MNRKLNFVVWDSQWRTALKIKDRGGVAFVNHNISNLMINDLFVPMGKYLVWLDDPLDTYVHVIDTVKELEQIQHILDTVDCCLEYAVNEVNNLRKEEKMLVVKCSVCKEDVAVRSYTSGVDGNIPQFLRSNGWNINGDTLDGKSEVCPECAKIAKVLKILLKDPNNILFSNKEIQAAMQKSKETTMDDNVRCDGSSLYPLEIKQKIGDSETYFLALLCDGSIEQASKILENFSDLAILLFKGGYILESYVAPKDRIYTGYYVCGFFNSSGRLIKNYIAMKQEVFKGNPFISFTS